MNELETLMRKAEAKGCRIALRFDPEEIGEQWGVKFYPHADDDAHFYAYNTSLYAACRQLLDELRGFTAW